MWHQNLRGRKRETLTELRLLTCKVRTISQKYAQMAVRRSMRDKSNVMRRYI